MLRSGVRASLLVVAACGPERVDPDEIELVYARRNDDDTVEIRGARVGHPDLELVERQPTRTSMTPGSWSFDGSVLAVFVYEHESFHDLWLVEPGSDERRVIDDVEAARWSPTRFELALGRRSELDADETVHIFDATTGRERLLGNLRGTPCSWSPDGDRLAVLAALPELASIYIVTVATGEVEVIDADPMDTAASQIECPEWSPRGELLVFVKQGFRPDGVEVYSSLYGIESDGRGPRWWAAQGAFGSSDPRWSPDGMKLGVASWVNDTVTLSDNFVNVCDLVSQGCAIEEKGAMEIAWAADGRRAIVTSTVTGVRERTRVEVQDGDLIWHSAGADASISDWSVSLRPR